MLFNKKFLPLIILTSIGAFQQSHGMVSEETVREVAEWWSREGAGDVDQIIDQVRKDLIRLKEEGRKNIAKAETKRKEIENKMCNITTQKNPLHKILRHRQKELASFLARYPELENHINNFNKKGNTPLHIACHYNPKENIKILLEHGANPNLKNLENKKPRQMISNYAQDIQLILLKAEQEEKQRRHRN